MDHVEALRELPIYDLELVDVVCVLEVMETLPSNGGTFLMCSRTTTSLMYEFSQKELNER